MIIGDIAQIRIQQTSPQGKPIENVFFYRATAGDVSLQSVTDSFWTLVGTDWLNCCQSTHTFVQAVARNLFDDAEFYNLVINDAGNDLGNIGARLPDFVALRAVFPRGVGNIRAGQKRFLMGGEGVLDDGYWSSAWRTAYPLVFCAHLNNTIQDPNPDPDAFYQPVVVKRIFTGLSPNGRRMYRLPETQAEAQFYSIGNVLISGVPTSQVSRK